MCDRKDDAKSKVDLLIAAMDRLADALTQPQVNKPQVRTAGHERVVNSGPESCGLQSI